MAKIIRHRLLKKLDWYIIKKFLGTYFFTIALIIIIMVVFDFNEHIDKLNKATAHEIIFEYYLNFIPYFINMFSPLFVFIAIIFFTSKLAENSEIIAMFSTGMSFRRMMVPYLLSAAFIAGFTLYLGSQVIPKGNVVRLNFESRYKLSHYNRDNSDGTYNIQLEVEDGVIAYIESFQTYNMTGYRFALDKFEGKKLVSHLTARSAAYDTLSTEKYHWKIRNYMIRDMSGTIEEINQGNEMDTIIRFEPADFLIENGQQETMSSGELREYIHRQKSRGFGNIQDFEIEYHKRHSMSFAAFILTIIGVSLSSRKRKGGMGLHLGIGLGLSFGYILFQSVAANFAITGSMTAFWAEWLPNFVFIPIAVFLYIKAPK
ncbi:MAG: LptF/LptG family permease [Bacteroidaceae bacterium]|nr:LptF/LptG family permease [Bacteroidaceae bacterium]